MPDNNTALNIILAQDLKERTEKPIIEAEQKKKDRKQLIINIACVVLGWLLSFIPDFIGWLSSLLSQV